MEIDRDAIVDVFLLEAAEKLVAAEDAAMALESAPEDGELVQALFRAVHTIKGDADSLGFSELAGLAHTVEDLLDDVRRGRCAVGLALISLLLESIDALRAAVNCVGETGSDAGCEPRELLLRIASAHAQAAAVGNPPARASIPAAAQAGGAAAAAAQLRRGGTLRVAVEKLDAALELSGEIAVALARVKTLLAATQQVELLDAHYDVERLHRELQEQVISLRMTPIGPMLRGFTRTVYEVALAHDKQARLLVEGADVTVDANVIEQLRGAMTHLIRNALDHGIERPAQRRALGKDPRGRIVARARREAGAVVVELEDDGAGLQRDRIAARARELGLLGEAEPASDAELFALVWRPGFSTAEQLTGLSGRGVGMDAVKRVIESLRGSIALASRAGAGTTVTIRLPVCMALLDGFTVGVDDEVFVLPREAIRTCMALPPAAGDRGPGLLDGPGGVLPLFRLRELFAWEPGARREENLVVLHCDGAHLALAVDHLFGELRTVISPVSPLFRAARAVTGYTVLGSGRIALVLDVPGLFREAHQQQSTRPALLKRWSS